MDDAAPTETNLVIETFFKYMESVVWLAGPMRWIMEDGDMHYALIRMMDTAFAVLIQESIEPLGYSLPIAGLREEFGSERIWMSNDHGNSLLYDVAISPSGEVLVDMWNGLSTVRGSWRPIENWRFYLGERGHPVEVKVSVSSCSIGESRGDLSEWLCEY